MLPKNYTCPICIEDTTSHSFTNIGMRDDGIHTFYSCPSRATKYWDHHGVMEHFKGMLDAIGEDPWKWIFDAEGFSITHALEVSTATGLARMISESDVWSRTLQEVIIINPTWHIRTTLGLIRPFLKAEVLARIRVVE